MEIIIRYIKKAMKRILGVIGSSRKNGNTHILVSGTIKGAKEERAVAGILKQGYELGIRLANTWKIKFHKIHEI